MSVHIFLSGFFLGFDPHDKNADGSSKMRELHNKVQGGRFTPSVCRLNQIASAEILEIE